MYLPNLSLSLSLSLSTPHIELQLRFPLQQYSTVPNDTAPVSRALALSLKEDSSRWAVQRGFHIIFAVAAVDSVRQNFCSSYVSLGEREAQWW